MCVLSNYRTQVIQVLNPVCHLEIYIKYTSRNFVPQLNFEVFFFFKIYLFTHERQRERETERQRHRQREKQAPCGEPDMGLHPGSPGSGRPGLKAALNRWATRAAQDFIYFREGERESAQVAEGEGRDKQTPCWAWSTVRGLISGPWDHDLSPNPELFA